MRGGAGITCLLAKTSRIFFRIGSSCLRSVETNPRMRQKISAPFLLRNEPEIFCMVLIMRIACSATLFVNGTSKSYMKASTACLFSNRSRRFFALLCLIRPFFFSTGGGNDFLFLPAGSDPTTIRQKLQKSLSPFGEGLSSRYR